MAVPVIDSTKAVKRLKKEHAKLKKKLPYVFEAGPKSDSNMLDWVAKVKGPAPYYEGGKFKVQIQFPPEYPMKAPELIFLTKIYHPAVGQEDGKVCPEVLGKTWAPVLNIFHILETLNNMLLDPSGDHIVEAEVAEMFATNPKKFKETCKKWVKKHAK